MSQEFGMDVPDEPIQTVLHGGNVAGHLGDIINRDRRSPVDLVPKEVR